MNEKFDKNDKRKSNNQQGPRVNSQIRVPEVRLITDDGVQHGIVSLNEARALADQSGLDLVEISPNARPPVVRIIDYGKYKYEAQKKIAESRKKQATIVLKEIQFRPNIEANDLQTKLKKVGQFFEDGHKVKLIMQFKGREMAYKQSGLDKFNAIIDQAITLGGIVESQPKMMGSRIISLMATSKKA